MRQLVHYYENFKDFKKWCRDNKIENSDKLIVEINYPSNDERYIKRLLTQLGTPNFQMLPLWGCRVFAQVFVNHPKFPGFYMKPEPKLISH